MAGRFPRRDFLAALIAGASLPAWSAPPGRTFRVGFLGIGDADTFFGGGGRQILAALAALGYARGRNLELVECYEKESPEKLFACARKLAALRVDAIVTEGTTSTLAARDATRAIPIVTTVGDPVTAGFAASLRRPGGNITGIAQNRAETARKQIELLRIMRPRLADIAILWEPPFPGADILMRPIVEAAREASIATHEITRESSDLAPTLARMRSLHLEAAFLVGGLDQSGLDAARAARVAIISPSKDDVEAGALFAVEPDTSDAPVQLASILDKVLRGANPAEMPFQSATRYLTVINARTAEALGIRMTPDLLIRAERIIR